MLFRSATILGITSEASGAEPPPETTTLKIIYDPEIPGICYAPQYVAEEFLRAEGFKNIRYVKMVERSETKTLAAGQADIGPGFGAELLMEIDNGTPITVLSGLHIGCL